jgi:hypothetical protein
MSQIRILAVEDFAWRQVPHSPIFRAGLPRCLAAISIYLWSDDLRAMRKLAEISLPSCVLPGARSLRPSAPQYSVMIPSTALGSTEAPSFTRIWDKTPVTGACISCVTLSVSISTKGLVQGDWVSDFLEPSSDRQLRLGFYVCRHCHVGWHRLILWDWTASSIGRILTSMTKSPNSV